MEEKNEILEEIKENEELEAIKAIEEEVETEDVEADESIEKVIEKLQEIELGAGFEDVLSLLVLSEEDFNTLAPFFLMEIEKGLNSSAGRIELISSMERTGVTIEMAQDHYEKLIQLIDEDLKESLSDMKRDFLKRIGGIVMNSLAIGTGRNTEFIEIPVEKCHPEAKLPTYANVGDAGMDLYALEDVTIAPGETKLIKTGLKMAVPFGYELQVRPKSGRCLKTKLRVANAPGTIDSGYRDEIGVIMENVDQSVSDVNVNPIIRNGKVGYLQVLSMIHGASYTIGKGEKFAQLVLNKVPTAHLVEVSNIEEIAGNRGGGFGSSGLK